MEAETGQAQEAPNRPVRKTKLIIALSLALILVLGSLSVYAYTLDHGVFFSRISLYGVDISGLTPEQGRLILEKRLTSELSKDIAFEIPGEAKAVDIPLKELGLSYSLDAALEQAWSVGRQGNLIKQMIERLNTVRGREIPLAPTWDNQVLEQTLEESLQGYSISPENAYFEIGDDNTLRIIAEQPGRTLDLHALSQEIREINPAAADLPPLKVPFDSTVSPEVTKKQLESLQITGLLASFTTYFDSSQINRTENIRLAAKAIDKKLLAPADVFSFNETVGERTAEAGYKEAMVIEGDVFTPGLGGGICQVSSTLYNAVLQGRLQIVERHPHSLPITYVAPGRDATVSFPVLDLKFRNSSPGYLLIRSRVQENSITFELYGRQ